MAGGHRGAPHPRGARAGGAGRPARDRLRLGGRAPLPRGVLALFGARGFPGRVRRAHRAHPPRPRHRPHAARLNHPARVAERIAMLDLVSRGRVEFGTGESASRMELEGFGIPPTEKRAMWREAVAQVALMLSQSPYPGYDGTYFKMPPRNVLPKPVQKPPPPMWRALSSRPMSQPAGQPGLR